MFDVAIAWLGRIGPDVFWSCTLALVTLDAVAVAAVLATRSRELVNRWTGRVLAANLLLAGVGVGVPAAAYVVKLSLGEVSNTIAPLVTVEKRSGSEP